MEKSRRLTKHWWWILAAIPLAISTAASAPLIETWEGAVVRRYPASTLIGGSAGKWLVVDRTMGCKTNRHRAEIVRQPAGKALVLTTINFGRCTLPHLSINHAPHQGLRLDPATLLMLHWTDALAPLSPSNTSSRVQLELRSQSGHQLVYVLASLNRPARTEIIAPSSTNGLAHSNGYHEIFLTKPGDPVGEYARNLHHDFSQVPLVDSNTVVITNITFSLSGVGSATVDNLRIAPGLAYLPPRFVVEPVDRLAPTNGVGRLQVEALGTYPLAYQWQKNGHSLAGAVTPHLAIAPMTRTNADRYRVIVSNGGGAITSRWAMLTLVPRPILHLGPNDLSVVLRETIRLEARGTSALGPLRYRWRRDGIDVAGPGDPTLIIPSAQAADAGLYTVLLDDGVGTTESSPALVSVIHPDNALRIFELTNGISLEWPTHRLTNYQVEFSYDLQHWWPQGPPVVGTGNLLVHEFWMPEKPAWHPPPVSGLTTTTDWGDLVYGNGIYLARNLAGEIGVSEDGYNWRIASTHGNSGSIVFGNGRFVNWYFGEPTQFFSSEDGVHWTRQVVPGQIQSLTFGDGSFIGVGIGITMESTDGLTWTSRSSDLPKGKIEGLIFAGGLLIAGYPNARPGFYVSADRGVTWNWHSARHRARKIVFARDKFVSVGLGAWESNRFSGIIATSTNGYLWKEQNIGTGPTLHDIGFWEGRFVAVGEGGTLLISDDATNWIRHSTGDSNHELRAVVAQKGSIVVSGRPGLLRYAGIPHYFRISETSEGRTNFVSATRRTGAMTLPRALRFTSSGQLSLRSVPWKTYQLETSSDLPNWSPLGDPLPGTGDDLFWPADLVSTGPGNFRVRVTDQLRRLADIYFGRFTNVDTFLRERAFVVDREEKRLFDTAQRTNIDYLPAEEVNPWLARLLVNDQQAWFYDGLVKGSLWRLTNDILPYWKMEKIKSADYPEWNEWVSIGVTDHTYHLKTEGRTHSYLLDHQAYNIDGLRREQADLTRTRKVEMYLTEAFRITKTQSWMERSPDILGLGKDWVNFTTNSIRAPEGFSETINVATGVGPKITVLSRGGSVLEGDDITFYGDAVGTEPIDYQWHHDGQALLGETNRQLHFRPALVAHEGRYILQVRNGAGKLVSTPITLTVSTAPPLPAILPPQIILHPVPQRVGAGEEVMFDVQAAGASPLAYQWRHQDMPIPGATNTTLRFDRSNPTQAGSYSVIVSNVAGVAISIPAPLDVLPEFQPPGLTVASPRSGARLGSDRTFLQGLAQDDVGIQRVEYRIGEGNYIAAIGTTNWSTELALPAGLNRLTVRSVDSSANFSAPIVLELTVVAISGLTIDIAGAGTVTPFKSGTRLEIGKTYRMAARSASGHLFAGWGGDVSSPGANLSFLMRSNMIIQARFIPDPFPGKAGKYAGLIGRVSSDGEVPSRPFGFCKLTLNKRGTFTASADLADRRYSFAGNFHADGHTTTHASASDGSTIDLALQLGPASEDEISGTFSSSGETAKVTLRRSPFSPTRPAPQAGNYTVIFSDESSGESTVEGYGLFSVHPAGSVSFRGRWANGIMVRQESFVYADGSWTFQASLPSAGIALGTIKLGDEELPAFTGEARWIGAAGHEPGAAGFEIDLSLTGERLPPLPSNRFGPGEGLVSIGGGTLSNPVQVSVSIDENDRVVVPGQDLRLILTLDRRNGEMKGSFRHPSGYNVTFRGVQLPQHGSASGLWRDQNRSGYIRLQKTIAGD